MHDVINIVLASDNNYAQHVAVVVASVLCNTKEKVNFHLLSDGISKERFALIAETARALGCFWQDLFVGFGQIKIHNLANYIL